ncbi:hypothetical protein B0H10DRAFT_1972434 [Mycena sp. CBHHK59/15]|nr:hypothetical protein B0H10DRAFT_1972434 [Mycena sp. CBHHK59/15]
MVLVALVELGWVPLCISLPNKQALFSNIQASQIVHCPPPSRIFQGRRNILDKMCWKDTDCSEIHKGVIILVNLIIQLGKFWVDIFFVDTSTIATIETGLKNIAIAKGFGNSLPDGLSWLTSRVEEWLLFFDNADDPSINLNDFIPQCNHGNIIITSQNPELCVYAGSHSPVSDMEDKDAVGLLLKSVAQEATIGTEQIAIEIVKALHYFPLAIVQAGAFISKSRVIWLFVQRTKHSYLVKSLLSLMTVIPGQSLFIPPSSWNFRGNLQLCIQFLCVTNELQAYSLISFDAEKKLFSIHPLVHAWARTTVQNPDKNTSTIGSVLGMAISERADQDIQLASLIFCPHVELALKMDAEVALSFRYQYGLIFLEVGKYQQTAKLLKEVLETQKRTYSDLGENQNAKELIGIVLEKQKQILGDNHPDTLHAMGDEHPHTLHAMHNLAKTYSDLGDHPKAAKLNVILLEKQKQLLGDNHPHTYLTMHNLSNTYLALGEHEKGKDLNITVVEKLKQLLGDNHPDTLQAIDNPAFIQRRLRNCFGPSTWFYIAVLYIYILALGNPSAIISGLNCKVRFNLGLFSTACAW